MLLYLTIYALECDTDTLFLFVFTQCPQQSVPPVMAFHLGSLGFLTPFEFNNYQEQVTNVLEGEVTIQLSI